MEILRLFFMILRPPYYVLLLLLLCIFAAAKPARADSGEYQVKAAMIYNFTLFMDWPEDSLSPAASKMTVCVAGKGPLVKAVDSLREKQAKGKTITVRQLTSNSSVSGCQVLVLGDLDTSGVAGLLERSRTSAVLTVAESAGFAGSGGVVGFVLQGGKVRFEINPAAAQRHRIRISAQLLKLAQIVRDAQ
jgi:hypothetical protein